MTKNTSRRMTPVLLALGLLLGRGGASAAAGERVRVTLIPTAESPGASGQAVLRLRTDAQGETQLVASASAKGLTPNVIFSLCVDDTFVDSGDASARGRVVLSESPAVTPSTLSGLTVTIRRGGTCADPTVLTGTVP